jgi:hypothetical protein
LIVLAMVASVQAQSPVEHPQTHLARGQVMDCRSDTSAAESLRRELSRSADNEPASDDSAKRRFLAGDVKGALGQWNQAGQSRVFCVDVDGLVRTPRSVVIDYLGASPDEILTVGLFERMERQLAELPIASRSSLRYDPIDGGSMMVTAIVRERTLIPRRPEEYAPVAVRAAFVRELQLKVAGPSGWGAVWTPSYRFASNRPRALLRFDAPAPGSIPGVLHVEGFLERQAYRFDSLGADIFNQRRERVAVGLSDWMTGRLRWSGSAAYDRIGGVPYAAVEGSLNARLLDDHVAVIASAGRWTGTGHGDSFGKEELVLEARSTRVKDAPVVTTIAGVTLAGDAAPLAIWPGASASLSRGVLLRAHPLRDVGVVTGGMFGRQIVFSTTEYEHPIRTKIGSVSLAGFVDAARASRRLSSMPSSETQVDVGGGVRIGAFGEGKVRLDLAYGLHDGHVRASADYVVAWGVR